jgi:hypothetical protein
MSLPKYDANIVREVLINLNNETGQDFYSVEPKDDVGNWIDSFFDLTEALHFISTNPDIVLADDYFRDTRTT